MPAAAPVLIVAPAVVPGLQATSKSQGPTLQTNVGVGGGVSTLNPSHVSSAPSSEGHVWMGRWAGADPDFFMR